MAKNIKTETAVRQAPQLGWAPKNTQGRLLSQLDAATGRLTGDQQQYYANLPSEEFSPQPSTSNKLTQNDDGSTEYRQLQPFGGSWRDGHTGGITVTGAGSA